MKARLGFTPLSIYTGKLGVRTVGRYSYILSLDANTTNILTHPQPPILRTGPARSVEEAGKQLCQENAVGFLRLIVGGIKSDAVLFRSGYDQSKNKKIN